MDGVRNLRDSFLEAAAIGLLATATLYVGPLHVASRLDRWLFDIWSHIAPAVAPPDDILLVHLDDPTALDAIAELARAEHARLLVSTEPRAPATQDDFVLGPVELPLGETRVRRAEWRNGGHLRFEPDIDGVVRNDVPLAGDRSPTPSLALRAAEKISGTPATREVARQRGESDGRRWLRFYSERAFPEVTAAEVFADPARLRDKVLIAGGMDPTERTPLGPLSTSALLAHAISGYLQDLSIKAGILATATAWALAALLIGGLGVLRARNRPTAWLALTGGVIGMLVAGATAFGAANLWLPVTGPLAWLLLAGSVLAIRVPAKKIPKRPDTELVGARRAAANGLLAEAWSRYRQISPTPALLPELYDLASQLDAAGNDRYAADLFHRIAQLDGQFRDVARRLVRASQPGTVTLSVERSEMPATMGRYQLLEPIGRGAMGYVYLGRDPKINRIVALKAVNLAAEVEPVSSRKRASASYARRRSRDG